MTPKKYLDGINKVVRKLDSDQIDRIVDILMLAYKNEKQIFIFGNGGSAATSSHFSSDLAKTVCSPGVRGFKTIPMTDNIALMTAWGNDTGYSNIFYGQLYNLLNAGDIVIGISGGGMSDSVIKGIQLANKKKAITIGFSGFKGGKLKELVQECVVVPSNNYQYIEDVHMILVHLITSVLKTKLIEIS